MTVAELIEELRKVPQDLRVQVLECTGYGEVDMEDVASVSVEKFSYGDVVWIEA